MPIFVNIAPRPQILTGRGAHRWDEANVITRQRRLVVAIIVGILQSTAWPAVAAERRPLPIRLPLTFIRQNAVATIVVEGHEAGAVIDTGGVEDAPFMLSKTLIESSGGIRLALTHVSTDAFAHNSIRPIFRVPAVTLGGRTFHNVTVIQAPTQDRRSSPPQPAPNMIGRKFLSQYLVVLDFPHRSITLWPPQSRASASIGCADAGIPMESIRQRELAVSVFQSQHGRLRLLFDTGASYSALPETLAGKLRLPTVAHGPGRVRFYDSSALSADGRDFGPLEFVILPLKPPADFQGMIGWNFFMRHVTCLDYRRREIYIR